MKRMINGKPLKEVVPNQRAANPPKPTGKKPAPSKYPATLGGVRG